MKKINIAKTITPIKEGNAQYSSSPPALSKTNITWSIINPKPEPITKESIHFLCFIKNK